MKKTKILPVVAAVALAMFTSTSLLAQSAEAFVAEEAPAKTPDDPDDNFHPPLAEQEHQTKSISIYPNPAKDYLMVQLESSEPQMLYVYNVIGNPVIKQEATTASVKLEVGNLKPGIYLIKVKDEVYRFTKV